LFFFLYFFFCLNTLGCWKVDNIALLSLFNTSSKRRKVLLFYDSLLLLLWNLRSLTEILDFLKLLVLEVTLLLCVHSFNFSILLVTVSLEAEFQLRFHFNIVKFPAVFAQMNTLFEYKHEALWSVANEVFFLAMQS
jgi:hypothetical protein